MPVEEVRSVLAAPDLAARNALIAAHLKRMEDQLDQTQAAVASLRSLVERPHAPISVEHRTAPATSALAISETVSLAGLEGWWTAAFGQIYAVLRDNDLEPAGPAGALFAGELFEQEVGDVVAFVPTRLQAPTTGRAHSIVVPPAELAVTVHHGPHADVDRTYGALGTYVAEHTLGEARCARPTSSADSTPRTTPGGKPRSVGRSSPRPTTSAFKRHHPAHQSQTGRRTHVHRTARPDRRIPAGEAGLRHRRSARHPDR